MTFQRQKYYEAAKAQLEQNIFCHSLALEAWASPSKNSSRFVWERCKRWQEKLGFKHYLK